ncbi:hypothetical protein HDU67_009921 [Dinochytrium kinnereticum]|nr:hypothetical protein HDU67_009921 [Dinochytrium kinnereticum]
MSSVYNHAQGYNRLPDDKEPGQSYPTSIKQTDPYAPIPYPRGESQRRFCGCFRTRASCCGTFCVIILFILLGLGILGFFAFPRMPKIVISDPYVPATSKGGFKETGDLSTASKEKPYVVTFEMAVNGTVYSPNYFSLQVDEINIKGNLLDEQGKKLENAVAAGQSTNINFKSFQNTTFVLPINLNYSASNAESLLTDKVLILILKSCGILPGSEKKDLRMEYEASFKVPLIAWTGYKPFFNGKMNFPCPQSAAKTITAVLTKKLLPINMIVNEMLETELRKGFAKHSSAASENLAEDDAFGADMVGGGEESVDADAVDATSVEGNELAEDSAGIADDSSNADEAYPDNGSEAAESNSLPMSESNMDFDALESMMIDSTPDLSQTRKISRVKEDAVDALATSMANKKESPQHVAKDAMPVAVDFEVDSAAGVRLSTAQRGMTGIGNRAWVRNGELPNQLDRRQVSVAQEKSFVSPAALSANVGDALADTDTAVNVHCP